MKIWTWLAISLAIFNIFDTLTTLYALRHGATEGNPIVNAILLHGGVLAFIICKLAVLQIGFILAHSTIKYNTAKFGLIGLNLIYFIVICNNFYQLNSAILRIFN
jgi:hypothetical protein